MSLCAQMQSDFPRKVSVAASLVSVATILAQKVSSESTYHH